jgi:hypothetical protein
MTTVMNTDAHDLSTALTVDQVLDFYTEQVNAAIAANRDDIVRELSLACEQDLAAAERHAA